MRFCSVVAKVKCDVPASYEGVPVEIFTFPFCPPTITASLSPDELIPACVHETLLAATSAVQL
jgi:hypothetical protein